MTLYSRAAQVAVLTALGLAIALAGCSPAAAPPSEPGPIIASTPGVTQTAPNATQPAPPYYAAVWAARSPAWSSPQDVTIRDTYTAKTLLTVRPPAPYQTFSFVAGTGAAGRWVVGAQRWHKGLYNGNNNASQFNKLYLLTYHAASGTAALTPLPVDPIRVNQLIGNVTNPEMNSGAHLLAAVALSPDGRQLATIVTSKAGYRVTVTAVPGGTVRSWSAAAPTLPIGYQNADIPTAYEALFTLTWLSDQRTLAMGMFSYDLSAHIKTLVRYLDTAAPEGSLLSASRTVVLSFPPAPHFTGMSPDHPAPLSCTLPPVAARDGATVVCPGFAATGPNAGGYENVGFWVLSARTGQLTAIWAPHGIGGPANTPSRILWASPDGRTAILTGVTAAAAGSQLFIRAASGELRQIPWPGFIHVPLLGNIVEPDVAW
ncbi:hypothetical protein EAS64_10815 [Trebonia kvetii]|uniref:WD40 repeat domain-containing protein n=1 Tax=Trebonia kvetii TaxID=2480626 RepID=A0A6P2C3P8_9ACTN|nr:hypothetical protein [Trebonia kvetii]TVZ05096.1 hypothetical protein EAS64_10815 [Trebonia kvetii]